MATPRPVSPGAALLRSSRMFSLPPPLPSPVNNVAGASMNRSRSATTPFPTLQSITTPISSRIKGDWGFKRPLPLRTTIKTTTPIIRVKQIDTAEHVTDFGSAADHSLSLQKFQEMHIPMVVPTSIENRVAESNLTQLSPRSVFEEDIDFTAVDAIEARQRRKDRWKFSGPWLAGMAEGEFQKYIKNHVRPRRAEFRQFLKAEIAAEINQTAAAKAQQAGEAAPSEVSASDVTSQQITEKLRRLREDRPELFKLIGDFLDLAPIRMKARTQYAIGSEVKAKEPSDTNPYAAHGPPITHPSAGMAYLRTNAFLENHPLYGPQAAHRHVKSRVLMMSKGPAGGGQPVGKLGVGGFVANNPAGDYSANNKSSDNRFDPSLVGGRKLYVEPHSAVVDPKGKVRISVTTPKHEAVVVAKELDGEEVTGLSESNRASRPRNSPYRPSRRLNIGNTTMSSSQSYGFGLADGASEGAANPGQGLS